MSEITIVVSPEELDGLHLEIVRTRDAAYVSLTMLDRLSRQLEMLEALEDSSRRGVR